VVREEKDLGVMISGDLKVSVHCNYAYQRASRVLGMIGRSIEYKSPSIMVNLYRSLVRPHLEYGVVAWSPHYEKDKQKLERVQHRFTRMIPGLKDLEYEERIGLLGLMSLEERRNRADLIELYRMTRGVCDPADGFLCRG
jgi:ribonuclease P/MRP protein subunit RPP40